MQYFCKADLKTGMILEVEPHLGGNPRYSMVLLGTLNGDIVSGDAWWPLDAYSDAALFGVKGKVRAVYQPRNNCDFLGYGDHLRKKISQCTLIWEQQAFLQAEQITALESQLKALTESFDKQTAEIKASIKNLKGN